MFRNLCLLVLATLLMFSAGASAAEYPSARAYAMGGAYTALASDISALQYNPAGLGQYGFHVTAGANVAGFEILSDLEESWDEFTSSESVTVHGQAGIGLGGVAVGGFASGNIQPSTFGEENPTGSLSARFSAGGAGQLLRLGRLAGLRAGLSVNMLQDSFVSAATDEITTKGYSLNVGLLAALGPFSLGVSASDVYSVGEHDNSVPYVEPTYRAGAAVKLPILGTTLSVDYEEDETLHVGGEMRLFFNAINLRAGQVIVEGVNPLTTVGLGLNLGPLYADLAAGSYNTFQDGELEHLMVQAGLRF